MKRINLLLLFSLMLLESCNQGCKGLIKNLEKNAFNKKCSIEDANTGSITNPNGGGSGSSGGGSTYEDCTSASIGDTCGGGIVAGLHPIDGDTIITTPGNCTNSSTPVCVGGTGELELAWSTNLVSTGVTSTAYGDTNTDDIVSYYVANGGSAPAAEWCNNLIYGGYTDWFLPSQNEMWILYTNKASIGGYNNTGWYWLSAESSASDGRFYYMNSGGASNRVKTIPSAVRCVRTQ
ncbi:DUF1566 domain-containing protein [Bacteriovoracaceae bacterium]|nr:DUF1566 domain-containing protein [Bacteriovoracaceae bacterium]